jgi:hypothetical protein
MELPGDEEDSSGDHSGVIAKEKSTQCRDGDGVVDESLHRCCCRLLRRGWRLYCFHRVTSWAAGDPNSYADFYARMILRTADVWPLLLRRRERRQPLHLRDGRLSTASNTEQHKRPNGATLDVLT